MGLLLYNGSLLSSGGSLTADPSCCCNNPGCCCEGLLTTTIPTSLSLTLASPCAILDGKVVPLALTAPQASGCRTWLGKLTLSCAVALEFWLYCDFDATATSVPCRRYRLKVQHNSSACVVSANSTYHVDLDCSCDPLVLTFTNMVSPYPDPVHGGGSCLCCDPTDTFSATVTA